MRDLVLKAWARAQLFKWDISRRRESGQTTIEYILLIIVALILISVIVFFVKGPLREWWNRAVTTISSAFNDLTAGLFGGQQTQ